MLKNLITALLVCLCIPLMAQDKVTLSGTIKDQSGEPLIGASIFVKETEGGTTTDMHGQFKLKLTPGTYHLEVSFVGYNKIIQSIDLKQSQVLNFDMEESAEALEEVKVEGERADKNVESTDMGRFKLDMDKIKKLPAFMGEVDVIKTIQLLPGVQSGGEGNQGFYVRGGGPDQNLILLDQATIYNASHLFGFFSVFNTDAIEGVELIKGGMPANFGSRLSSVLDIEQYAGSNKKWGGKGAIGVLASKIMVEGPLIKDKASIMASGRRTYLDLYVNEFIPDDSPFKGSNYYFYDLNLKTKFQLSQKDYLYFSGYFGRDVFTFNNNNDGFQVRIPWGNTVASLQYRHLFSDKFAMNLAATYTDYNFSFDSEQDGFEFKLLSGVMETGAKLDFTYQPSPRHNIKFGIDYKYHIFTPSSVSARSDSTEFDTGEIQKIHAQTGAIYIMDDFDVTDWFKVNVGLRYSIYQQLGPYTEFITSDVGVGDSTVVYEPGKHIEFYHGLEPRLAMRFKTGESSSIKAGFTYNYQYIHMASLSSLSLPTDVWFPSTQRVKPQKGWQVSAGYFQNLFNNKYEGSIEVYYKDLRNMIAYKDGALPQETVNDNVDSQLTFGKGYSYGVELFFKKRLGQFTGWIGYTWSQTMRQFDELNDGEWFPAKYDRRHDLSVVASYELNKQWSFGATFVYATGNAITLPIGRYFLEGNIINEYGPRNSYRMPPYHRLDISVTWKDKPIKIKTDKETGEKIEKKRKFRNSINLSVYNVYSRNNPFFIFLDNEGSLEEGNLEFSAKQVSLFPILPSLTWIFEF